MSQTTPQLTGITPTMRLNVEDFKIAPITPHPMILPSSQQDLVMPAIIQRIQNPLTSIIQPTPTQPVLILHCATCNRTLPSFSLLE